MPEKIYILVEIHDDDPNDVRVEIFGTEDPEFGPALETHDGVIFWYGFFVTPVAPGLLRYRDPEPGTRAYVIALDLDKVRQQVSTTPAPKPC